MRYMVSVALVALLLFACGGAGGSTEDGTSDSATTTAPPSAEAGEELFHTFVPAASNACSTCHRLDDEDGPIAPTLKGISARAGQRVEGLSAAEYIRQSIMDPEAFQVDDWNPVMPENYAEALSEEEISSLVAFLLTQ